MIQYKQDIRCADFESAIRKAIREVEDMKHATPQAKREVYDILIRIREGLLKWEDPGIEIPAFMRETR